MQVEEPMIETEQNPAAGQQAGKKEEATSPGDVMADLTSSLFGKGNTSGYCFGCCLCSTEVQKGMLPGLPQCRTEKMN